MLLSTYDQAPEAASVWPASLSGSGSSSAVAGFAPLPAIDWRAHADIYRPTAARDQALVEVAPLGAMWRLHGTGSATSLQRNSSSSNSPETVNEYFFFDDEPSPLFGVATPASRCGPVGYWHALTSDSGSYSVITHGLDVTSLISSISDLDDGWNGPGSIAPNVSVRSDIAAVLNALWNVTREPEIEVGDDGDVALLWDDQVSSFALTFFGNGKVVGTMTPFDEDYVPWTAAVSDADILRGKVSYNPVSQLLV